MYGTPKSGHLPLHYHHKMIDSCWHIILHPSNKVTQPHNFDRLYFFYPGIVFIKLDIPGKPVYLPFDWCLICSDCFTEACLGWVNFIGFYWKCVHVMFRGVPYVSVCTKFFFPRQFRTPSTNSFAYSQSELHDMNMNDLRLRNKSTHARGLVILL